MEVPRLILNTSSTPQVKHENGSVPSDFRTVRIESSSSIKITAGCEHSATANSALTNFSLSPIHLLVRLLALTLKNVA